MSTLPPGYRIRAAQIENLATLADIERAASKLFRDTPYSFLVDSEPLPLDFVKQQFREGRVWVAVDERDAPVGYAVVQEVDENVYLQQMTYIYRMGEEVLDASSSRRFVFGQNIITITGYCYRPSVPLSGTHLSMRNLGFGFWMRLS